MLGLDNPIHILFLLGLLLLVFGAKRLPEMGRSLGTGLRGFKDSLTADEHHTPLTVGESAHQVDTAAARPVPLTPAAPTTINDTSARA